MKTYSQAPDEICERVAARISSHYPILKQLGVRVDCVSVTETDPDAPAALTHQGYAAYAVIRVTSAKERAMKRGDCEITFDEMRYMKMTDKGKDSLIDHELYHLEPKLNKHKRVGLDENGRPKFGLRKHDFQFGWFKEIAQRHGINSIEVKQAAILYTKEKAALFPFVDDKKAMMALEDERDLD